MVDTLKNTHPKSKIIITYRGLISETKSATTESQPKGSEIPCGKLEISVPFQTPVGHSFVLFC